MPPFVDEFIDVIKRVEKNLSNNPFDILNESELQAVLQHALLQAFPQKLPLTLAHGVIERRSGGDFTCRQIYREAKVKAGQSGREPDMIVLKNRPQVLLPKKNGAPSRFETPYQAIIETKVDATFRQILSGHHGKALSPKVTRGDLEKWNVGEDAEKVLCVVYTAHPEWYADRKNIFTIRRPLCNPDQAITPLMASVEASGRSYDNALKKLHEEFKREPYWFLREKDFETALFIAMRQANDTPPGELNPVRTQWWSEHESVLNRRRRHDLVVLSETKGYLTLELELKTSHSDSHNWFTRKVVKNEFDAMQILLSKGLLDRAVFLLFRFGPVRWQSDADALCAKYPSVEFDYRCSEL